VLAKVKAPIFPPTCLHGLLHQSQFSWTYSRRKKSEQSYFLKEPQAFWGRAKICTHILFHYLRALGNIMKGKINYQMQVIFPPCLLKKTHTTFKAQMFFYTLLTSFIWLARLIAGIQIMEMEISKFHWQ